MRPRLDLAALLLASLVLAGTVHAVAPPDPARFAADIRAFEVADSMFRAPSGSIVFYGSSSIRMWHPRLADDFPQLTVLGRGFGGSTMSDAAHFADRVIRPLAPRAVVLYEGDNDIEMGRTPAEVLADFDALLARVQWPTRVYVIGIKPSAARWAHWPRAQEVNRGFAMRCRREPKRLFYVDIAGPMLNDEGKPRPELFLDDRLHLSASGYNLWRDVVGRALERELAFEEGAKR